MTTRPYAETDFVKWVNERKRVLEGDNKIHKDIAAEMGLSPNTLSMYTTGKVALPFEHLFPLLHALGVRDDEAILAVTMAQEAYAGCKVWESFGSALAQMGMTFGQLVKSPGWRDADRRLAGMGIA